LTLKMRGHRRYSLIVWTKVLLIAKKVKEVGRKYLDYEKRALTGYTAKRGVVEAVTLISSGKTCAM